MAGSGNCFLKQGMFLLAALVFLSGLSFAMILPVNSTTYSVRGTGNPSSAGTALVFDGTNWVTYASGFSFGSSAMISTNWSQNTGYTFSNLTSNCPPYYTAIGNWSINVTPPNGITECLVTANFAPSYGYRVVTDTGVGGGTVIGAGSNYYYGQVVPIIATPDPGYGFVGWRQAGGCATIANLSSPNTTITVTPSLGLICYAGADFQIIATQPPVIAVSSPQNGFVTERYYARFIFNATNTTNCTIVFNNKNLASYFINPIVVNDDVSLPLTAPPGTYSWYVKCMNMAGETWSPARI